jgi:hypothetical protein
LQTVAGSGIIREQFFEGAKELKISPRVLKCSQVQTV